MDRITIINTIGSDYHTANIETGEYSYVLEAGSKAELEKNLVIHFHILSWILDLKWKMLSY